MAIPRLFALLILAGAAALAPAAAPVVDLLLLSPEKAILTVDGERAVLAVGDSGPGGVRLLAIEDDTAILEVDGETRHLGLSRTLRGGSTTPSANATGPARSEHRIYVDNHGMYRTTGSINGFPVDFIVDTGATTVVLNGAQAGRLGIDYRMKGKIIAVATASRVERGYLVKLRSVKLGSIELLDVDATVLDSDFPPQALLGMSFLGRLQSERSATMLLLRKGY